MKDEKAKRSPGVRAVVRSVLLKGNRWKPDTAIHQDIDAAIRAGLIRAESDGFARQYSVTEKGAAMFPDLASPLGSSPVQTRKPSLRRHSR